MEYFEKVRTNNMAIKTSRKLAFNILKAEIAKRGLTLQNLHGKLEATGVKDSYDNMRLKINRGAFEFSYFLDCMKAIGAKTLDLESYFEACPFGIESSCNLVNGETKLHKRTK